jgi:hypothetical protein
MKHIVPPRVAAPVAPTIQEVHAMTSDNGDSANRDPVRKKRASHESLSTALVRALAEYENRPIEDIDPVYEYLDLEALDELFTSPVDGTPRSRGMVVFDYHNATVTIMSEGLITINPDEITRD